MKKKFLKYFKKSNIEVIIFIIKEMFNERLRAYNSNYIYKEELEKQLKGYGLSCPLNFFESKEFIESGFVFDNEKNFILKNV